MKPFLVLFIALGTMVGSLATAEAEQRSEPVERTLEIRYISPWLPVGSSVCAPSNAPGSQPSRPVRPRGC